MVRITYLLKWDGHAPFGLGDGGRVPPGSASPAAAADTHARGQSAIHFPIADALTPQKRGYPPMYLTKKHLSRRSVLQGLGVSLGLPLLDAMIPAATSLAAT